MWTLRTLLLNRDGIASTRGTLTSRLLDPAGKPSHYMLRRSILCLPEDWLTHRRYQTSCQSWMWHGHLKFWFFACLCRKRDCAAGYYQSWFLHWRESIPSPLSCSLNGIRGLWTTVNSFWIVTRIIESNGCNTEHGEWDSGYFSFDFRPELNTFPTDTNLKCPPLRRDVAYNVENRMAMATRSHVAPLAEDIGATGIVCSTDCIRRDFRVSRKPHRLSSRITKSDLVERPAPYPQWGSWLVSELVKLFLLGHTFQP